MEKKKKKTIFKNIMKKTSILMLSALLIFTSVFSSYDMNVHASDSSLLENILIQIVEDGSILVGAKAGKAIGDYFVPGAGGAVGEFVGGALGGTVAGSLLNSDLDWYVNSSESGKSTVNSNGHGGHGKSFDYQYNKGVQTSQNTTNYNTTKNMSIYNENKTWNTTTNNYDYTYNWYNPITNNYDITNEYTYNTTYNTYNYVTHNFDITNNYNYTTNYYIQDNRTYVSYYIINVCDETGEEERDYIEMYYELPDGRNSLYLTVDDIKGQYFPSNYSKYISVAEDDGTTLGLWHLDGDLKDSSYHGNTAGSAYNNVYTDGLYTSGKQFSDSSEDFMELKLDKVDLPNSWTLEWCEYIEGSPSVSPTYVSRSHGVNDHPISAGVSGSQYLEWANSTLSGYFFNASQYDIDLGEFSLDGVFSFGNSSGLFSSISGFFVPYCLTFDGGNYCFYANGNLVGTYSFPINTVSTSINSCIDRYNFKNISPLGSNVSVTSDSIKFGSFTEEIRDGENYVTTGDRDSKRNFCHPTYEITVNPHKNAIIDEVRLSSGVLYTGDSYTPSSQVFTTNTVLAVPENPSKHEIAFKTNTDISEVRFGGARPTYPTNGYVFVSLDADDKVESIQQYQEDGWYEIEASLYTGTDWVSFKEVNMEYLGIDGVGDTDDTGGDTGGDSGNTGGDSGDTGGDSSGGGVSAILEGIGKFFDTLLTLVGKIIGMLSDFVNSVLTLFESFTVFTDGFSGFLTGAFGFIPQEAINVIVTGITLLVILAIIKFLK